MFQTDVLMIQAAVETRLDMKISTAEIVALSIAGYGNAKLIMST